MDKSENKSIGKWISAIHREFQIYINNEVKELGINSSEYIYLINLGVKEGVNLKQLSDDLMIDPSETTRIIKRLEEKGYVRRERSSTDRRAFFVYLTEKGQQIQPLIDDKLQNWTSMLSRGMTEDEIDKMISQLMAMTSNCKNYLKGNNNEKE